MFCGPSGEVSNVPAGAVRAYRSLYVHGAFDS